MARRLNRSDFTLPKAAVADLEQLVSLVDDLPRILEASTKVATASHVSRVLKELAPALDIPVDDLKRVFTSLENLRHMSEDIESADGAIDGVAMSLAEPLGEKLSQSKAVLVEAISRYTSENPVSLSIKAQRLVYARERLYNDVEMITDARPVFSSNGETIVQFVITHSMSVTSFANNRLERMQFSLDNADVIELRKACDRAILKSRTLKRRRT